MTDDKDHPNAFFEWLRHTFGADPLVIEAAVPHPIVVLPFKMPKKKTAAKKPSKTLRKKK